LFRFLNKSKTVNIPTVIAELKIKAEVNVATEESADTCWPGVVVIINFQRNKKRPT
jgi:hypothetical protein